MPPSRELAPEQLYRHCELAAIQFETTEDLEDLEGLLGQPRADRAIEFGVGIEREGYNIFAFGPDGTGKHSAVRQILERRAAGQPAPPDLCYVHDFEHPERPRLLRLPGGRGRVLRLAMEHLVEELAGTLQTALESEEYQERRQKIEGRFDEQQQRALKDLGREASADDLALVSSPVGFLFAPRKGEQVLSAEEFRELPERERKRFEETIERYQDKLQQVLRQLPRWKRETRERLRALNQEVSRFALGPLLDEVRELFEDLPEVGRYLEAVERDVVENAPRLGGRGESVPQASAAADPQEVELKPWTRRYRVNVLVDHGESEGLPVIYEDNPTYPNLVGRVEHLPYMGTLVTDFTLIKPGALHRSNGGYLLLDVLKLLRQPYAWEGLKRCLRARQIKIEGLAEALSLINTYSLQPEPAKLDVKIILFGSPLVYYLLSTLDSDFGELFKVAVDFDERLDWTDDSAALYARLIAKLVRENDLRPFDRSAVARTIEHGARAIGDSRKVSLYMGKVLDVMREADYWAGRDGGERVTAEHVQRAVEERIFRSDRIRHRIQEEIARGTLLVDTEGATVGQVNGLAVYQLNEFAFGRPSRITARVRLGKGEVVDIEREVELSGPTHSKGVLILAGFLGAHFAADRPLSLSASLVFEQSYTGVEGDSASSAELYALLSAIAGVPLRQDLAVTGSVNQRGEIQAIGGVNQKIEGFYDVCAARGLTGDQGVLIPAANVQHLMLRSEVVDAVRDGRFHVYPVETVEQGIELLTGLPAGERDDAGAFPGGSLYARVEARLADLAEKARAFGRPAAAEAAES